jgi:hypothetical protein
MVFHTERRAQAEGVHEHSAEEDIWAKERVNKRMQEKLYNKGFSRLAWFVRCTQVVNSRDTRWVGNVACMGRR